MTTGIRVNIKRRISEQVIGRMTLHSRFLISILNLVGRTIVTFYRKRDATIAQSPC